MEIIEWLKLPETKDIHDLDAPSTSLLHAKIIQKKPFLKKLYLDFYRQFKKTIGENTESKLLVELGSGGGFIQEVIPNVVTSDIIKLPDVDQQFSALKMPFKNKTVDSFLMIDVLHHIKEPRLFFKELNRCLKVGGKIMMIEPANTLWGRFIWQNFHHEPFDPSGKWELKKTGRLSSANGALPWIIFYRDRRRFENEFPSLKILELKSHTPFRYLISGGVSVRQLLPSFNYNLVKAIEKILSPFNKYLGMFLTIELKKVPRS